MKYLLGVLLSLFVVGNCYGFETGKWVGSETKDGYEGSLFIEKSGNSVKVTDVTFGRQETKTRGSGCGG